MRRELLGRTALMGNGRMPAADTRLMAELVLLGQFVELEPVLFYRRIHEDASSWDRADTARQTAFWGGAQGRFVVPHWRLYRVYFARALGYPLPLAERLRLVGSILQLMYWGRGALARDLAGLVRMRGRLST